MQILKMFMLNHDSRFYSMLVALLLLISAPLPAEEIALKCENLPSYNDSQIGYQIANVFGYDKKVMYLVSTNADIIDDLKKAIKASKDSSDLHPVKFPAGSEVKIYCILGCSTNGADDVRRRSIKQAVLRKTDTAVIEVEVDMPEIVSVPFEGRVGTSDIRHMLKTVDLSDLGPGQFQIQIFQNHRVIEENITKATDNQKVISENRSLAKSFDLVIE